MNYLRLKLTPVVPLCLLAGCAVADDEEMKACMQAVPRLERDLGGAYADQAVQRYVSDVGTRIVRSAGRQDLSWQFKVLDSDQINAFALPGGRVYITRGLLARLENEAQLASILGHEVAHIVRGHAAQQLQRAGALGDGAIMAVMANGSAANDELKPFIAGLRKYSRDQEKEADLSALTYLARQGYDPRAMVRTMEILIDVPEAQARPEFLATHPTTDNRQAYLEEAINKYFPTFTRGKTNAEEFQRVVFGRRPNVGG